MGVLMTDTRQPITSTLRRQSFAVPLFLVCFICEGASSLKRL